MAHSTAHAHACHRVFGKPGVVYAQVETLQAVLEEEQRGARARDARQRLAVERLRRQVVELQVRLHEMQKTYP